MTSESGRSISIGGRSDRRSSQLRRCEAQMPISHEPVGVAESGASSRSRQVRAITVSIGRPAFSEVPGQTGSPERNRRAAVQIRSKPPRSARTRCSSISWMLHDESSSFRAPSSTERPTTSSSTLARASRTCSRSWPSSVLTSVSVLPEWVGRGKEVSASVGPALWRVEPGTGVRKPIRRPFEWAKRVHEIR